MRLVAAAVLVLSSAGLAAEAGDGLNCRDGEGRAAAAPARPEPLGTVGLPARPETSGRSRGSSPRSSAAGFDAFDVWVGDAKEEDLARWEAGARASGLGIGVEFGPTRAEDADAAIAAAKRLGSVYLDAHAASYFTPEAEAEALLRGLVERCRAAGMPLVIQTHRGRVTQDLLRTVGYAQRIPDLRFDVDFSHYIVAGEMGGEFSKEAAAALFVLIDRAIMLDGRVSNGEQVQVDLANPVYARHVERTAAMWKLVMVRLAASTPRAATSSPSASSSARPITRSSAATAARSRTAGQQQKTMKALVERLWNEAVAETGNGQVHRTP